MNVNHYLLLNLLGKIIGHFDIKNIYLTAHKLKCKGITVYRYGSKENQVLTFGYGGKEKVVKDNFVTANSEYSGGCATGICPF